MESSRSAEKILRSGKSTAVLEFVKITKWSPGGALKRYSEVRKYRCLRVCQNDKVESSKSAEKILRSGKKYRCLRVCQNDKVESSRSAEKILRSGKSTAVLEFVKITKWSPRGALKRYSEVGKVPLS